jgi:hypothetical protein
MSTKHRGQRKYWYGCADINLKCELLKDVDLGELSACAEKLKVNTWEGEQTL